MSNKTELKPCTKYARFNSDCESMMTLCPCDNCADNMIKECIKNMTLWERFREYMNYLRFKIYMTITKTKGKIVELPHNNNER